MSRNRVKERCYCKEEEVYCRLANTNPTCIHYTGLRQCSKNAKNEYDWKNFKDCHPSPSCGFKCCFRMGSTGKQDYHCSVVKDNNKTMLWE